LRRASCTAIAVFVLPASVASLDLPLPSRQARAEGMKKILIVDDCEAVRAAVRYRLESQAGLEVCGEAVDGTDAIEKAKQLQPDLILLDLNMPKMNGAAAASVLKSLHPRVPIILFTMYEDAIEALAPVIGVDVVLSKPAGLSHLIERVQGLLEFRPQTPELK
jgi:DNA-binding NarL/FixJ family response regulator